MKNALLLFAAFLLSACSYQFGNRGGFLNALVTDELSVSIGGPYNGIQNKELELIPVIVRKGTSSEAAREFLWNFGDGNTDMSARPHHAYSTPGVYVISLTVQDSDGLEASSSTTATIAADPDLETDD